MDLKEAKELANTNARMALANEIASGNILDVLQELRGASLKELAGLFYASFYRVTVSPYQAEMITAAAEKLDRFVESELRYKAALAAAHEEKIDMVLRDFH